MERLSPTVVSGLVAGLLLAGCSGSAPAGPATAAPAASTPAAAASDTPTPEATAAPTAAAFPDAEELYAGSLCAALDEKAITEAWGWRWRTATPRAPTAATVGKTPAPWPPSGSANASPS